MMANPKINIPLDNTDKILEAIGWLGVGLLIVLPIYYYSSLPEIIPRHFDLNGKPDGFSPKGILWFLPIIGTATYLGLTVLNKYPHTFNYAKKVNPENAERLYTNASKMIRALNTCIVCFFALITYYTIQISLGTTTVIPSFYLYGFLILIFGLTGYYVFKSLKD